MNIVYLKPKRDYPTLRRHPWIFSGAISGMQGSPAIGETVEVRDSKGVSIGYGSYSPF
jgi:23S rRNA (cytosine1962-C5)-methyltransferase